MNKAKEYDLIIEIQLSFEINAFGIDIFILSRANPQKLSTLLTS